MDFNSIRPHNMPNAIYYLFTECQVVQFVVNVSSTIKETSIRNHQTNKHLDEENKANETATKPSSPSTEGKN